MVWCSHCKRPGHWTSQCYSKGVFCTRCGREGHKEAQCYATYGIDGECIASDDEECYACAFCTRTFDTEKGATLHETKWCKKRPVHNSTTPAQVLRDSLHAKAHPHTPTRGVYVLRLDDGCIYVGKSDNVNSRIAQHRSGTGQCARWCSVHGTQHMQRMPTRCPPSGDDLDAWEKNETLVQMMHHGVDKVRGWAFTSEILAYEQLVTIKTLITEQADVCRVCGHEGHFASACASQVTAPWLEGLEGMIELIRPATHLPKRPLVPPLVPHAPSTKRAKANPVANDTESSFVEQAKSGRSKCKVCSQPIAKGEWRRGTQRAHPTYGRMTSFVHLTCSAPNT